MRIVSRLWSRYNLLLDTRPLITRSISTGVVLGVGDTGAQLLLGDQYDAKRSLKMAIIGACVVGPQVYYWFRFLELYLPGKQVPRVILKVVIDQTLVCPYFIALNFAVVGLWSGKSLEQIVSKIKLDLFPTQVRAWCFWPVIHYITFGPMPYKYRMLWANCMSTMWNGYLSSVSNKDLVDPVILEQSFVNV